nr:coat protein [Ophiovirus freesiae]
MSGKYSVQDVVKVMRASIYSPEQKELLMSLKLINDKEQVNEVNRTLLYQASKENPDNIVHLKTDDTLMFIASETVKQPQAPITAPEETLAFKPEIIKDIIEAKTLALDQDKIQAVLDQYVKDLPKSGDTYKSGDVIVKEFKNVKLNISSLLAAGTKVLDAILYMTYKDSADHSFIFSKETLSPESVVKKEIASRIDIGNKAIKSSFCLVYNQGGLPSKSSSNKTLSKFIKETVFRDSKMDSDTLCDFLSSADPSFFPASVFLNIPLDHVHTEVASRCKMAIAGNKAIRYAKFAAKFEKDQVNEGDYKSKENIKELVVKEEKLKTAHAIVEFLCSLASNFEAQKKMHPLSPGRSSRKNFTLQLTCAIMFSRSKQGRMDMRSAITSQKIESFKRDENLYGSVDSLGHVSFPIFENGEADFSELSVPAIRAAYGFTI